MSNIVPCVATLVLGLIVGFLVGKNYGMSIRDDYWQPRFHKLMRIKQKIRREGIGETKGGA